MEEKRLLRAKEVCELLGISPKTLLRWRKAGILSCYKFGKIVRFDPEEVKRLMKERRG